MIYQINEAMAQLENFKIGDIVELNEQCNFDYNYIFALTEEEQLSMDTPYMITDIYNEFDMQELSRVLCDEEYEIEGEILYQLYNVVTDTYCGALVDSECVDKIGSIIETYERVKNIVGENQ